MRTTLADRFVLQLVNRRTIAPDMFEEKNRGIYLNSEGRKIFLVSLADAKTGGADTSCVAGESITGADSLCAGNTAGKVYPKRSGRLHSILQELTC